MRRFSQRSHLVTLSEINITPLLDLAFVLLIIFVITTPLLEQGLELNLPQGGRPDDQLRRDDYRTVEVGGGFYLLEGRQMGLAQLRQELGLIARSNPNTSIFLRADRSTPFDAVFQVFDVCADLGLAVSCRSEPRTTTR